MLKETFILNIHNCELSITTHNEQLVEYIKKYIYSFPAEDMQWNKTEKYTFFIEELGSSYAHEIKQPPEAQKTNLVLGHINAYYYQNKFYAVCNLTPYEMVFDYYEKTAYINIGADFMGKREDIIHFIARSILRGFIFAFSGLFPIHAAVVQKDNVNIMLYGKSGAGKSTLSMALCEQGYALVSDDSPLFIMQDNVTYACSSPDDPRLDEKALELLPGFKRYITMGPDSIDKYAISKSQINQNKILKIKPVDYIIELNRSSDNKLSLTEEKKMGILNSICSESVVCFDNPVFHETPDNVYRQTSEYVFEAISQLVLNAKILKLNYNNSNSFSDIANLLSQSCKPVL